MNTIETLRDEAIRQKLDFLIIGGNAAIALGSNRTTYDIDLLIPASQTAAWVETVCRYGYKLFQQSSAFVQFTALPGAEPIDLMIVNEQTWAKLSATAVAKVIRDQQVFIPAPINLIALKIFAAYRRQHDGAVRDWTDIQSIVRTTGIDVHAEEVREIVTKYGGPTAYEDFLAVVLRNDLSHVKRTL